MNPEIVNLSSNWVDAIKDLSISEKRDATPIFQGISKTYDNEIKPVKKNSMPP
jgi:hypothetical protein